MNILGSSPKKVCHKDRATDGKHKIFSIGSLLTDESSVKFISIYVRGIFGWDLTITIENRYKQNM